MLHGAEAEPPPVKKTKSTDANLPTVRSVLAEIKENSGPSASTNKQDESRDSRDTSLVEIGLDIASTELTKNKELSGYQGIKVNVIQWQT